MPSKPIRHNAPRAGFDFAEAFMVMRYEGPGGRREWVWNSRDGITPFVIRSADNEVEMSHGNWHLDRFDQFYVPAVGTRVFVDLVEEMARPRAIEFVEKGWLRAEYPMSAHPMFAQLGKEGTVEYFIAEWVSEWGGHAPHVAVVTPALRAQFAARRKAHDEHGIGSRK